jgi:DNA-binding response OmpR family regulator
MNNAEKKMILLAEDDDSMRRFVEIILTKAGFKVFAAEDGLIAMQFALENVVDAVIADAIMPHLSGFDLCRMINENSAKRVPCIILSGLEQNSSQQPTEKIADIFLAKDANLKINLVAALDKLL